MADETTTGATDTATQPGGATELAVTETLLTGGAAGATGDSTQTTKVDDAPAVAPEKYDLKMPDGIALDPEVMAKYEPLFRENNLTNEAAQKLVDQFANDKKAEVEAANAALVKQHDEWLGACKSDTEFGGQKFDENIKHAQSFLARYGTPELKQFLNKTGAGSHPELVRAFVRAGKAMAEDTIVTGKTTAPPKSPALQIFPSMQK